MTPTSPYLRPRLEATATGCCDSGGTVEDWLEELRDTMQDASQDEPAQHAYSMLALQGRLARVRPELCKSRDAATLIDQLRIDLDENPQFFREALDVPNPVDWLRQAEALAASYDEPIESSLRTEAAWQLLQDFDDAGLVRAIIGAAWQQDVNLEREWQVAAAWLQHNREAFLAASVFIQNVAGGFRPDLPAAHPQLAATADLYVQLLDMLEEFEAECRYQNLVPFTAHELSSLVRDIQPAVAAHPHLAFHWLAKYTPAIAAQGVSDELPGMWVWRSPDARYVAQIVVHPQLVVKAGEMLRISFHVHDDDLTPATDLVGTMAFLDGVSAKIQMDGLAVFDSAQVEDRHGSSPELATRDESNRWTLEP